MCRTEIKDENNEIARTEDEIIRLFYGILSDAQHHSRKENNILADLTMLKEKLISFRKNTPFTTTGGDFQS